MEYNNIFTHYPAQTGRQSGEFQMANKTTDVAIIGTGIVGIATAYFLAINWRLAALQVIRREPPS